MSRRGDDAGSFDDLFAFHNELHSVLPFNYISRHQPHIAQNKLQIFTQNAY